jgi:hypothetical protein
MIRQTNNASPSPEPHSGRPVDTAEGWLGRNRSDKRSLWERLNPRHRKELRLLAEALALEQAHARLPEPARSRLDAAIAELERLVRRVGVILAEVARRTPPLC